MTDKIAIERSIDRLAPEKRVEYYRELAKEAIANAHTTFEGGRRAEFLAMAASWHSLAVEAERSIRAEIAAEFSQPDVPQSTTTEFPEAH